MSDRLTEIRAAQIAQNENQPMWVRDLAADYCETVKKLALQEGYTRGWEERARKAESERDDLLVRFAACEQERDEAISQERYLRDESEDKLLGKLRAAEARVTELETAARALYERVEMDESVGICLSDRTASLNLGAALAACEQERDEAKAASEEHVAVAMEAVADADKAEARLAAAEQTCPLCGHEWRRHDPEDGKCDAGGDRHCGRDLAWMQQRIAALSRAYLAANTEPG